MTVIRKWNRVLALDGRICGVVWFGNSQHCVSRLSLRVSSAVNIFMFMCCTLFFRPRELS